MALAQLGDDGGDEVLGSAPLWFFFAKGNKTKEIMKIKEKEQGLCKQKIRNPQVAVLSALHSG